MDYNAYELLGLSDNCTKQEATDKYYQLRKQYLEDRFLPGEEGEKAAEKLQELDVAYRDILEAIAERTDNGGSTNYSSTASDSTATGSTATGSTATGSTSDASSTESSSDYGEIQELIKQDRLEEAQQRLDARVNRDAEWHYIQSILFYKRNWFLESKKQLEMACSMEPDNERYKQSLEKLTKILASNTISPDQMRTSSRPTDDGPTFGAGNGTCTGSSCGDCLLCNACCNCASCMAGPGC